MCVQLQQCYVKSVFKFIFTFISTVIAFYLETDKDLMEVIQETITSEEVTFSKLFSRNKMLRRKLNRRARSLKQSLSDTC